MERLVFNEEGQITDMCSKEGEVVPLINKVETKDTPVEKWCKHVETEMVETMRELIVSATAA